LLAAFLDRGGGGFRRDFDDGFYEPIAFAGDGLDEARLHWIVVQDFTDLADGGVDSVFSIDEDFGAPEMLGDFSPGDEVSAFRREQDE
jgi:hypothetical protein